MSSAPVDGAPRWQCAESDLPQGTCNTQIMARAQLPTGIELEYQTFGSPSDPTMLVVMGFTAQMTAWPETFYEMLASQGLHVVRFDNRDCGLSTHLDGQKADPMAVMGALQNGDPIPAVPYTLSDMAADGIGLLDHLGVERAHIMGASMGGMIVQTMAIEYPHRIATLTSIMSSPGDLAVGKPTKEARAALLATPPSDRDAFIESATQNAVWASQRYVDLDQLRANAAFAYDRAFYPEGATRQLAAIYASGDRSEKLTSLTVPTLVLHGRDDTLIQPDGGFRTAELIPGAHLLMLADMGHDMPEPLWPMMVNAIAGHIRTA
jgi:pimeloyl-ACP methyl ester carboxylesterase